MSDKWPDRTGYSPSPEDGQMLDLSREYIAGRYGDDRADDIGVGLWAHHPQWCVRDEAQIVRRGSYTIQYCGAPGEVIHDQFICTACGKILRIEV